MRFSLTTGVMLVVVAVCAAAGAGSSGKTLELRYPKALPVPKGSRYIKAPTLFWTGDMSNLSASGSTMFVGTTTGIQRIDAASTSFRSPWLAGTAAADIAYADGLVWASDYYGDVVRAVNERTGAVKLTAKLPIGSAPEGVVAAAGAIWVAEHHGGGVARIDPASGQVIAQVKAGLAGSSGPQGLAYGAGSLWASDPNESQVVRIDPTTNRVVATIPVGGSMSPCGNIAIGKTSAWVTGCLDNTWVARISVTTNKVVRLIDMHARSIEPVAQGDTAWFLVGRDPDTGTREHSYLVQLSSRDRVLHRYDLGSRFTPGGTAIAFGSLWASSFTTPWVARIPLG